MTTDLTARMDRIEGKVDRLDLSVQTLVEVVMGARRVDIDGVTHRDGGLGAQLDALIDAQKVATAERQTATQERAELMRKINNGGIKVKLSTAQVAVVTTIITAVGSLIVGIITAIWGG